MKRFKHGMIWLSRIHRSRGFGIQSPADYAFVRYVINEHWPYYAYDGLPKDDWLTRKLGRLYFRLANWRQPRTMQPDSYQPYWQAGCRHTQFNTNVGTVELARLTIEDREGFEQLLEHCNEHSVLVVEGISRDGRRWREIQQDERVGVTFDLYYCGIILFDKKRYKQHYCINF